MKCCSDPSSSSGPTSGPRPWPAPCPAPGLTPRTALASHPVASLRLQALALRATPARSLLQAPCPLRARKPGFTYKATHLTPCCLHTKGPGPQFAHCYHPEGRAGWVPASPQTDSSICLPQLSDRFTVCISFFAGSADDISQFRMQGTLQEEGASSCICEVFLQLQPGITFPQLSQHRNHGP